MYFTSQQEYERYHSPEQRQIRAQQAQADSELAVTEALGLFKEGDVEAARGRLFDAGFQDDGIAYYLNNWRGDAESDKPAKSRPKASGPGF